MFDLLESIGNCQLYLDFRSGSFRDWSGNNRVITPLNDVSLSRHGALFNTLGTITVTGAASLDLGSRDAATMVIYYPGGYHWLDVVIDYLAGQEVTADYFGTSDSNRLYLRLNAVTSFDIVTRPLVGAKYLAFSWVTGSVPDFYVDGAFSVSGSSVLTKRAEGTTDWYVGTTATGARKTIRATGPFLMFDKALSATEHAELYGALAAMRWPTKAYSHSSAVQKIGPNETGLKLGFDSGEYFDVSGNGNDGTPDPGVTRVNSALGDSFSCIKGTIDSVITAGNDNSLNITGSLTLSCWVKTVTTGIGNQYLISRDYYRLLLLNGNNVYFQVRNAADTGWDVITGPVLDNLVWHHVVARYDTVSGEINLWVDGVPDTPVAKTDGAIASRPSYNLRIGGFPGNGFDGEILLPKVYNRALSATEIAAEYAKGAKALTSTNWGVRETSAAVAGGNLTNTPFEVISGTHKIVTDTINGTPVKALECVTAGVVAMPSSLFKSGNKGAARGTFEFWVYKALTANDVRIYYIASLPIAGGSVGFNGYAFLWLSDDKVIGQKRTNGTPLNFWTTKNSYAASGVWREFRVSVANGGVFNNFIDDIEIDLTGGSGSYPVTDTSFSDSKFVVVDLDAGDKIALGAIDGSYAIKKYLGVV